MASDCYNSGLIDWQMHSEASSSSLDSCIVSFSLLSVKAVPNIESYDCYLSFLVPERFLAIVDYYYLRNKFFEASFV